MIFEIPWMMHFSFFVFRMYVPSMTMTDHSTQSHFAFKNPPKNLCQFDPKRPFKRPVANLDCVVVATEIAVSSLDLLAASRSFSYSEADREADQLVIIEVSGTNTTFSLQIFMQSKTSAALDCNAHVALLFAVKSHVAAQ
jgi:hypothetical protein